MPYFIFLAKWDIKKEIYTYVLPKKKNNEKIMLYLIQLQKGCFSYVLKFQNLTCYENKNCLNKNLN